jgi:hypothetical protein
MKKAVNIVAGIGAVGLLSGLMIYRMSSQLRWNSPLVAAVYICIASVGLLLIAGVLKGIDWVRKNVRIR